MFFLVIIYSSKLFTENFRAWMSAATGIIFSDRVDLTSSKYEYTGWSSMLSIDSIFQF